MSLNAPIALYDSGLGGLTVYRALREALPHETFLYVGDTARVPYGPRSTAEIIQFNDEIVSWLLTQGAKFIVVACNTSSALALSVLQKRIPVPIIGLIEAGAAEAAALAPRGHIAVIATEGTVRSSAYQKALKHWAPNARISAVACPALVPMIESGGWKEAGAQKVIVDSLSPLLDDAPDILVLGCTHYPHVRALIQAALPATQLVDPALPLARQVAAAVTATPAPLHIAQPGFAHFVVSGCPEKFFSQAEQLLPQQVKSVSQVIFETSNHDLPHNPRSSADLYTPRPVS